STCGPVASSVLSAGVGAARARALRGLERRDFDRWSREKRASPRHPERTVRASPQSAPETNRAATCTQPAAGADDPARACTLSGGAPAPMLVRPRLRPDSDCGRHSVLLPAKWSMVLCRV